MSEEKSFSDRLAWARAESGLTQKELADAAKISQVQVARYETGKSKPRLGAALKLARVLGMDAYDLMPELAATTKELAIDFSPMEARLLDEQAKQLGITVEELLRKLTIFGLKAYIKDPKNRDLIEKEEPGLIAKVEGMNEDD
jgi:transcriptional regulator with XRE-family HTH domain